MSRRTPKVSVVQAKWTHDVVETCKKSEDKAVRTLGGRVRFMSKVDARDRNWASAAERQARNTVPQGSAADIAKHAMVLLHRELKERLPGRAHILLMASPPPQKKHTRQVSLARTDALRRRRSTTSS